MADIRWPGWPFKSSDERMVPQPSDQQEPKLCECSGPDLSLAEMAAGKCETCGKPLIVEVE